MASVDVDDATFVRSIGRRLSVAAAYALGTEARIAFDAILAVAVGLLANLRLMQTPGVPAFQQDWVWPTSSATVRGWFELATLPWNWNGLGTPQIYPFADFFVSLASGTLEAKPIAITNGPASFAGAGSTTSAPIGPVR